LDKIVDFFPLVLSMLKSH